MLNEPAQDLEEMLTLKEVRDILGISYGVIMGHIRNGSLRAYKVTREPIRREEVGDKTYGLRFKPSDLREYLSTVLVKRPTHNAKRSRGIVKSCGSSSDLTRRPSPRLLRPTLRSRTSLQPSLAPPDGHR
jgi:hypothetical protein